MRAIHIDRHGGPEVLSVREVPDPQPAAGEVLIAVVASTINPVDSKVRAGILDHAAPTAPGNDFSGIVVESADDRFPVGARVVGATGHYRSRIGAWADLVAVPASQVALAPRSIPLVDAGTFPLTSLTAYQALRDAGVTPGDRVLVTGAIGGVGRPGVELARHFGAQVDGLVARPAQVEPARALGADDVFTDPGQLPAGRYDVVLDTVGVDASAALAPGGRYRSIVEIPARDGWDADAKLFFVSEVGADLAELVGLVDKGILTVRIAERFALTDIVQASERFDRGGLDGRISLLV